MRRILAMIAGVVLLLGAMAGTSAASSANNSANSSEERNQVTATAFKSVKVAAAPSGCGSGNFCFWPNAGYSPAGNPGELSGRNADWSVFSRSACPNGNWDNCASSDYNNGNSCEAIVWTGKSYSGSAGIVYRGTGGDFNSTFNNAVSSNSWSTASGGTSSACGGPVP
ncbi:peptidase inhibitor family I36 protein [Streptomyces tauricus]|uniref:Peptidase inhibitor family I36 protein n=1 Tax=Streptomyces tauricus TaxID=68274 RepID=A0ABZ1J9T7_9ACTN|nr:peptidase inhibitor family I36 protein [Streptomyces tauricus]MCW8102079.1 peptidase inhibitor family I36 protein [Streptomyces tauricus]